MSGLQSPHRRSVRLRDDEGAAILEFAVALPLLVVFAVGIYDFSGAFNEKQKLAQAAQEGAIIAGAQPMTDIESSNTSTTGPDSLQPVWDAVYNSLVGSGVLASGACLPLNPVGPPGANLTWTYTSSSCPLVVVVTRGLSVPVAGSSPPQSAVCTTVSVTYPHTWRFNSVIQLLVGATYNLPPTLSESATVHNQT